MASAAATVVTTRGSSPDLAVHPPVWQQIALLNDQVRAREGEKATLSNMLLEAEERLQKQRETSDKKLEACRREADAKLELVRAHSQHTRPRLGAQYGSC